MAALMLNVATFFLILAKAKLLTHLCLCGIPMHALMPGEVELNVYKVPHTSTLRSSATQGIQYVIA